MQSILLVDDRKENLVALESLLERPDLLLLKAENGNDALKLLLRHEVALVLLDVQMPGMNGFEVAELMRRNKKTQSIPIIFVTANGDKRQLFRGYEVGAVDYLAKPLDSEVLLSKIKVFLEIDRQKQELEQQLLQIQRLQLQNEQLLQALGDGVLAVDDAGRVSFVNPAMQHLFALDIDKAVGDNLHNFIFHNMEGHKTLWANSDIFLATAKGERFQRDSGLFIRSSTGEMIPAFITAAPIPSQNNYVGAVITLRKAVDEKSSNIGEQIAKKNRKQTRKRIGTVLRLFDRTSGMNMGRLVNISLEGFKLAAREEIAVGSLIPISMVLPETLAGSNTLSLDAQVVWCRRAEDNPNEYRVGFQIVRINENDLRVLVQLIDKY
jgi:CheY-like chemotaxis protein